MLIGLLLIPGFAGSQTLFVGGQLNYSQHFDVNNIQNATGLGYAGIGFIGEFGFYRNSIKASLNYGLPCRIERSYDLMNSLTMAYDTTISGFERYRFFSFAVDYKYYLFNGDGENGGFYSFSGAGISIATITNHPDNFDESTFETTNDYSEKSKVFQLVIRGGAGYEHYFTFGNIFIETFINFPLDEVFEVPPSYNLPLSVGLQTGIKIRIT